MVLERNGHPPVSVSSAVGFCEEYPWEALDLLVLRIEFLYGGLQCPKKLLLFLIGLTTAEALSVHSWGPLPTAHCRGKKNKNKKNFCYLRSEVGSYGFPCQNFTFLVPDVPTTCVMFDARWSERRQYTVNIGRNCQLSPCVE